MNEQADLNHCWAHMSEGTFYDAASDFIIHNLTDMHDLPIFARYYWQEKKLTQGMLKENKDHAICRQRRHRSACAFLQADKSIRSPLIESLGIT